MNKHIEIADISAYLDGELNNEKIKEVEDHLFACKSCLKEYEEFLFIKEQMKINYANIAGPSGLEEKVLASITSEPSIYSQRSLRKQSFKFLPPAIIFGAILMMMMAFVPLIATNYNFISAFFHIGMIFFHAATLVLNKLPVFVGVTITVLGVIIIGSAWSIIRLLPSRSLFEEETHPSTR